MFTTYHLTNRSLGNSFRLRSLFFYLSVYLSLALSISISLESPPSNFYSLISVQWSENRALISSHSDRLRAIQSMIFNSNLSKYEMTAETCLTIKSTSDIIYGKSNWQHKHTYTHTFHRLHMRLRSKIGAHKVKSRQEKTAP